MTMEVTSGGLTPRSAELKNIKALMSPEEGGTKKDHEDFLEAIAFGMETTWANGADVAHVIKQGEVPRIKEPTDLPKNKKHQEWEKRKWDKHRAGDSL